MKMLLAFPRTPDENTFKSVLRYAMFISQGYKPLVALERALKILEKVKKFTADKDEIKKNNLCQRIRKTEELIYLFKYMKN